MEYRTLGATALRVSTISFGAGPVPALLTRDDQRAQLATIRRALDAGVNWFDTAASYGHGRSEAALGSVLADLGALDAVHLATKVRLDPDQLHDTAGQIRRSVLASLRRLGCSTVELLQLHNSVTATRGDEPTSISPCDVLREGGVLDTFRQLQADGAVRWLGLTGLGQPAALAEVIASGGFHSIQVPYNILNRTAGEPVDPDGETDYGQIIDVCAAANVGVLAIRVLAGGALVGRTASEHTRQTKFFPLALYERDCQRAMNLAEGLAESQSLAEVAVRFVLTDRRVASALVGLATPDEVDQAINAAAKESQAPTGARSRTVAASAVG